MPGGYPGVNRVTDPATVQVLQTVFKQLQALQSRVATLEANALQANDTTGVIDAESKRLTNVADAQELTDAVNYGSMQIFVLSQIKGVP